MLRLGIVCDYPEENWPSMDLCAEMLLKHLPVGAISAEYLCPLFRRRLTRLPRVGKHPLLFNADRFFNRFIDYPRWLKKQRTNFDLFHLIDHSYSQLVQVLPAERTGVFCHDLDTFRCLLDPQAERRPYWFRAMARRILTGLQRAAVVFYTTTAVRRQIEFHGLVDPARLVYAPPAPAPEFTCQPIPLPADLAFLREQPYLLHVGSCIPRKRIDLLLDVFAGVKGQHPDLRLIQVGGEWTAAQLDQIKRLGIGDSILQLRGLSRTTLASLYQHAALVLLPSDAEGFGLPLIEALACGSAVVASDIPVLREVGGDAVVYCPPGDIPAWVETIGRMLQQPELCPSRTERLAQASRYSWARHAQIIADAYACLVR